MTSRARWQWQPPDRSSPTHGDATMTIELSKDSIDLGIVTRNPGPMLEFYRDVLGFEFQGEMPVPGGEKTMPSFFDTVRRYSWSSGLRNPTCIML